MRQPTRLMLITDGLTNIAYFATGATTMNIDNTIWNIKNWIIDSNVNQIISQMATVIMTHKPGINDNGEIFEASNEQIKINVTHAYSVLNQLIAVGIFLMII